LAVVESAPTEATAMARKVSIKSFDVDMEVKNSGVEFAVSDSDGAHKGDLYVTKKWLIWCPGKTLRENGKKIKWSEFAEYMESLEE
jgi:hypothetical protein